MPDMSDLWNYLGPGSYMTAYHALFPDPSEGAGKELEGIPSELHQYYDPYISAGQQAIPGLQEQYARMMSDPGSIMTQFGKGFQASPGYQYNVDEATKAASRAAAAGGMAGSPAEQAGVAKSISGLANQDYYNYLNHALSLYQGGVGGEEGLMKQGYGASSEMANQLANLALTKSKLAFAGQQGQNEALGGLIGAGASIATALI